MKILNYRETNSTCLCIYTKLINNESQEDTFKTIA